MTTIGDRIRSSDSCEADDREQAEHDARADAVAEPARPAVVDGRWTGDQDNAGDGEHDAERSRATRGCPR